MEDRSLYPLPNDVSVMLTQIATLNKKPSYWLIGAKLKGKLIPTLVELVLSVGNARFQFMVRLGFLLVKTSAELKNGLRLGLARTQITRFKLARFYVNTLVGAPYGNFPLRDRLAGALLSGDVIAR